MILPFLAGLSFGIAVGISLNPFFEWIVQLRRDRQRRQSIKKAKGHP